MFSNSLLRLRRFYQTFEPFQELSKALMYWDISKGLLNQTDMYFSAIIEMHGDMVRWIPPLLQLN